MNSAICRVAHFRLGGLGEHLDHRARGFHLDVLQRGVRVDAAEVDAGPAGEAGEGTLVGDVADGLGMGVYATGRRRVIN
jgi:hypothetical protein